jgi:colicin import membrane protein
MLLGSAAIHLAIYFFLVEFHFSARPIEAPVYYVDVVTLPVANPRAGTPSPQDTTPAAPAPATAPAQQEMVLPTKPPPKPTLKKAAPPDHKTAEPKETSQKFEERLAKIEQSVAGQHQAAAIDAMRKKVAGAGKTGQAGMPAATGTEAGSDYASYIRSRLTDAFRTTIAYQTKAPEVVVRLTINRAGKVIGQRFERSSNDRIFEDAVTRAIAKAALTFPPPPGGEQVEYSVRFSPEGVSKK